MSNELFAPAQTRTARDVYERIMGSLFKHFKIFLLVFLVTMGAGVAYTFMRPPTYLSSSNLMLGVSTSPTTTTISSLLPTQGTLIPQDYFTSIVNSQYFRQRLVESLQKAGYKPVKKDSIDEDIDALVDYTVQKNGSFMDIVAKTPDADASYMLVKHSVDIFKERTAELQLQELNATITFLDDQLNLLSNQIDDLERQIKEFEEKNEIIPDENGEASVWTRLYKLQEQLAETEVQISLEEMNYKSYDKQFNELIKTSNKDIGGLDNASVEKLKSEIESLQKQLSEIAQDPDKAAEAAKLRVEITSRQAKLIGSLTQDISDTDIRQERSAMMNALINQRTESEIKIAALKNQKGFYEQEIADYRKEHPDLLESALTYSRLLRAQEVVTSTFNILLDQREQTRVDAASETGGLKIIDPPFYPNEPEDPEYPVYIMISFLVALMLAGIMAYLADLFDSSIKDSEEVQKELGVSVLGMIPKIKPKENLVVIDGEVAGGVPSKRGKMYPIVSLLPLTDPSVEAYRSLRTGLIFAAAEGRLKSIVISSADHGDGKTLTASNLALAFAMGGKRTLLVDGDLRLPDQHKLYGVKRVPGLSDFMVAQAEKDEIFRPTTHENLWLVPAGSPTPSPSDLLASERMSEFLRIVSEEFDIVLIDAPPIHVAIDAKILITKTDGLVIVANLEKNSLRDLRSCVEQARLVDGKIFGVVFNNINTAAPHTKYYYGRQFSQYYYNKKGTKAYEDMDLT